MRSTSIFTAVLASLLAALPTGANAFEKLEGYFIAQKACEAYQSKNKQTNPGNLKTTPSMAYEMIGINKAGGDYFQVRIDDAPVTEARWVSTTCGVHVIRAGTITVEPTDPAGPFTPPAGEESLDNLLTLSWQPAFCEIRPGKSECVDLNNGLLPHTSRQLSIHGLWPQPKGNDYCGVPANVKRLDNPDTWHLLPAPEIDADTAEDLAVAMPGFSSHLHHHEWIKHGTCFFGAGGADEYYDDTLLLTDLVNASGVADLLAANVGEQIEGSDIRAAFDQAFGAGTGERVLIKCTSDQGRVLINELWISLKGEISPSADLGELMRAATPTSMGCSRGIIDPAGDQ